MCGQSRPAENELISNKRHCSRMYTTSAFPFLHSKLHISLPISQHNHPNSKNTNPTTAPLVPPSTHDRLIELEIPQYLTRPTTPEPRSRIAQVKTTFLSVINLPPAIICRIPIITNPSSGGPAFCNQCSSGGALQILAPRLLAWPRGAANKLSGSRSCHLARRLHAVLLS